MTRGDETFAHADSPDEVNLAPGWDNSGDAADQAERLTMVMQAEAVRSALNGGGGEGSVELDNARYPLEDVESLLAMEDADDASDDPMHAGGLTPARWMSAEESAIHVVDPQDPQDDAYASDETDAERADPDRDQFDGPPGPLTPEDATLLGIDPYE